MDALERAGHGVELASSLRTLDASGDLQRQLRLRELGARLADRLVRRYEARAPVDRPRCWFTYHLYHKAPDWLGPAVSRTLDLPYVVAEASVAAKRSGGPWDIGYRGALDALGRADAVVALNSSDIPGVDAVLGDGVPRVHLRPFFDLGRFEDARRRRSTTRRELSRRYRLSLSEPWLVTVAMMRRGNKLESYRLLARALAKLVSRRWRLLVAGDGEARDAVIEAFAQFPASRVVFAGRLTGAQALRLVAACELFAWPAVDEPLGMAMLEAQAVGVPVVAGAARGVVDIVRDGLTGRLVPPNDLDAFASALARLLDRPEERAQLGRQARCGVERHHEIGAAAKQLDAVLQRALVRHASRVTRHASRS